MSVSSSYLLLKVFMPPYETLHLSSECKYKIVKCDAIQNNKVLTERMTWLYITYFTEKLRTLLSTTCRVESNLRNRSLNSFRLDSKNYTL